MFSTTQLDVIAPLVQSHYEQGYIYYIVHTNTNTTQNYNQYNFYDLTFYFSKTPINHNDYTFVNQGQYIKVDYMTRNYSYNQNNDNRLPRESYTSGSNLKVTVNSFEHIQSNAENSIFMNTLALVEYNQRENFSFNIDLNMFSVIPVLLCVLIVFEWLKTWFAKNYRGEKLEK